MKQMKQRANYFFNEASNYLKSFTPSFLFVEFVVRFLTYDFYFSNFILFLIVNKSAYIIKMVSDRLKQSAKYLKAGPNWENALLFFFLFSLSCCTFDIVLLFWPTYCHLPINNFCFVSNISGINFLYILTDSL